MANEFKAAAERKKRKAEERKARDLISMIEEKMNTNGDAIAEDEKTALLAVVEDLKQLLKNDDAELISIQTAAENARTASDAVFASLESNRQGEDVSVSEPAETPADDVVEISPDASEDEHVEEIADVQPEEPADEVHKGGKIATALRNLYEAPRYSRVDGEKKERFSALIKPSLREKMEADRKAGIIKSPNDLINVLLEIYYGED